MDNQQPGQVRKELWSSIPTLPLHWPISASWMCRFSRVSEEEHGLCSNQHELACAHLAALGIGCSIHPWPGAGAWAAVTSAIGSARDTLLRKRTCLEHGHEQTALDSLFVGEAFWTNPRPCPPLSRQPDFPGQSMLVQWCSTFCLCGPDE